MGLKNSSYWFSWFLTYLIQVTFISVSATLVLSLNVINFSSLWLLFGYLWTFGISLFGHIMLISVLFSKPNHASIIGTIVYFGSSFIDNIIQQQGTPELMKTVASLFSTVAVARGAELLAVYECSGIGLNFSNL